MATQEEEKSTCMKGDNEATRIEDNSNEGHQSSNITLKKSVKNKRRGKTKHQSGGDISDIEKLETNPSDTPTDKDSEQQHMVMNDAGSDASSREKVESTPSCDDGEICNSGGSTLSNDDYRRLNNSSIVEIGDTVANPIDDDGDPIPSGTGTVSRDCSASDLIGWSELLPIWHGKLNHRPKGLEALVRAGVPDPLRGEVWQLLSGAQQCGDLMDQYRILLTRSAPTEQIILRDVHRTYPAHENFRINSGSNSLLDSLFKVCKAYAVYDEEVGYCQGLSFLVAALLLHMPEEQAFCVFVRIMKHYGLRDLFRNNFDALYLKFYQLERLLEDNMPDLYQHFSLVGLEPFTYASQWFLTVFTAKFPLNAVFYILDIFLLDGMNTIFQIALALLQSSKQELLAHDFEGILKYFRVQMPKKYRDQKNVEQLIVASSTISLKRLPKHAKSYEVMKQKERLLENPVSRLQRENAKLTENNLRLEQENDELARDLLASKIQSRAQLDLLEDKADTLNRALTFAQQDNQSYLNQISDMEDERSRLEVEVSQLKEVCRRELARAESEHSRDHNIIAEYKKICSRMSKRLDYRLKSAEKFIASIKDKLRDNESCDGRECHALFEADAIEFVEKLKLDDKMPLDECVEHESPNCRTIRDNLPSRTSSESDYTNRPVGALLKSTVLDSKSTSSEVKIKQLTEHVDELEVELARTKLALVEAECKCQQLTHDLSAGVTVKIPSSSSNSDSGDKQQTGSGLSSKLAAVVGSTTRRSVNKSSQHQPQSSTNSIGSTAFSKLNNLISERISNISQNYYSHPAAALTPAGGVSPSSLPKSTSSPSLHSNMNRQKSKLSLTPQVVKKSGAISDDNANETVKGTIHEHDQAQC